MDMEARINDNAPEAYRGLDRYEARKKIVADLEALGLVDKIEPHRHTVPYGDRSGVVIEPWLTDQWYVDAGTLAKEAIAAVRDGRTKFVPATWEKTYYNWMENIQPWCVSRQLWWGHRIPAWYAPDGTVFVAETEEEALAEARAKFGDDVTLERDPDVLDTWFSSALWPFGTLGWPRETSELSRYYPTSVLVTSFDIIFFWVARMMMDGLHFMGEAPFKTVYIHALVRDEHGQKMSKSKGNTIDPLEFADKYGADALRFTLAALETQGRDIKLSEKRVEGYRNFATKLWNAARFCEMNGCVDATGFDPAAATLTANRWIVSEVARAAADVTRALEAFRFSDAAGAVYQFVWGTFCDWYLEIIKPVLLGEDAAARAETQKAAAWVLDRILVLLHPFMPFVTEELWNAFDVQRKTDLILSPWPTDLESLRDETATAELDWLIRMVTEIRSVRAEMNVPPGAKITLCGRNLKKETLEALQNNAEAVARLARCEEIKIQKPLGISGLAKIDNEVVLSLVDLLSVPKGSLQFTVDGAEYFIPLEGVIDIAQERARLEKNLDKIGKEIKSIEGRLANEKFMEKAPAAVVEENRARKSEAEETAAKLTAALDRLKAAG